MNSSNMCPTSCNLGEKTLNELWIQYGYTIGKTGISLIVAPCGSGKHISPLIP